MLCWCHLGYLTPTHPSAPTIYYHHLLAGATATQLQAKRATRCNSQSVSAPNHLIYFPHSNLWISVCLVTTAFMSNLCPSPLMWFHESSRRTLPGMEFSKQANWYSLLFAAALQPGIINDLITPRKLECWSVWENLGLRQALRSLVGRCFFAPFSLTARVGTWL